jgi:hypothetical protein
VYQRETAGIALSSTNSTGVFAMTYSDTASRSNELDRRPTRSVRDLRETKPSFMTTEFWAMIVGVVAVIVIYNAATDASFNLWRAMTVGTALAVGYMISRGLAKAGSHDDRYSDPYRDREGIDLRSRS